MGNDPVTTYVSGFVAATGTVDLFGAAQQSGDGAEARLEEASTVGPPGSGFELVLKAFQLTRTVCTGLSLGAADHALDLTWDFTERRRLYGTSLIELAHVRSKLGELWAARHVVESIVDNLESSDPPAFYLHVHNGADSTGAVRGQLERD